MVMVVHGLSIRFLFENILLQRVPISNNLKLMRLEGFVQAMVQESVMMGVSQALKKLLLFRLLSVLR
ncbi:hypothetical protein P8452_17970 [Trifolium repens]|nr:hypothetical protein P8452_17970 [Trifolium repens]